MVFYLAASVFTSTALVAALLFSAAGGTAFNAIVYKALDDQIGRLRDRPTDGQVMRAFLRDLLPTTLHNTRKDLIWIREIETRVESMPDESERHRAHASMEKITDGDTPRTQRLKNAVAGVSDRAEERARIATKIWEDRIRGATSIGELRRMGWRISVSRIWFLARAMLDDDMKARWFPFGGRFLDYLGRGGAFGLVVASAIGGDRSDLTAWAGWVSNAGIVGGAVGSMLFVAACTKDVAYIDSQSDNPVYRTRILPDNRFNRFATRHPLLFAPVTPTLAVSLYLGSAGLAKAIDRSGLSDTTVALVAMVGLVVLNQGRLIWQRRRPRR
ncbi:hypothetical protein F4560_008523 [Saccharothrix ecbatanensis]|uniref:Uncharacterized protein n=1 Tax=Saccharothrix ecbatanensis TaxID=1105145 RepID=A0A7W9HUI8_9PSEU|nr:hypothetical protein [Saccharothrix ecbatanensis]MBB5808755.1 hypothetical protein [Saccharothrix ecbatanensis]